MFVSDFALVLVVELDAVVVKVLTLVTDVRDVDVVLSELRGWKGGGGDGRSRIARERVMRTMATHATAVKEMVTDEEAEDEGDAEGDGEIETEADSVAHSLTCSCRGTDSGGDFKFSGRGVGGEEGVSWRVDNDGRGKKVRGWGWPCCPQFNPA